MLRWTLLLLAIASTTLGVVGYLMHPPIAESALKTSAAETLALLDAHDRVLVTVDAAADTSQRIYPSLVERPLYTRSRPAENHVLPPPSAWDEATAARLLGAPVRFRGAAGGGHIALQGVEERTLQDDVVKSERLLVPLEPGGGRVWALSPVFRDAAAGAGWTARERFEGVLTRFADISANTATWTLEFSYEEIAALAAEHGLIVDDRTLLIIDGIKPPAGDLYHLPVAGSGGRLLLTPFHESAAVPDWVARGPLTGVLWVWDVEDDRRASLEAALGVPLGPRYGVIHHDDTAIELNEKTKTGLKFFTGLGAVFLALSLVLFTTRRLRRRGEETTA